MIDSAPETLAASAVALLKNYSFDYELSSVEELVEFWLQTYPPRWIHLALIEALYQGRYKAVSVNQILAFWQRRDQPLYHFTHEFERLVCNNYPKDLLATCRSNSPGLSSQDHPQVSVPLHAFEQDLELLEPAAVRSHNSISLNDEFSDVELLGAWEVSKSAFEPEPHPLSQGHLTHSSESPAQSIHPHPIKASAHLLRVAISTDSSQENRLDQDSIRKFIPESEPSDFHAKLTAMANIQQPSLAQLQSLEQR